MFKMDLRNSDLFNNPESDLDNLVVQFDTTLRNFLDKHAPLVHWTITVHPSIPWYNGEIILLLRQRESVNNLNGDREKQN